VGSLLRLQEGTLALVSLFVDTSVWSLALRRDAPGDVAEAEFLLRAIDRGDALLTAGLVLQELLQGFSGPRSRELILEHFAALPLVVPDREDHVNAAELRNACRRSGSQIGTIDALIAQLCIRHELTLLTTDRDFGAVAAVSSLKVWEPVASVKSSDWHRQIRDRNWRP
jgi:predicted nucleic acid-binding protein